jgi:hypothetical protein
MATFKELLKSRRQEGTGLISSVGSATFDKTREFLDIRNYLFKNKSVLNALFPSVKGFKTNTKLDSTNLKPLPTNVEKDSNNSLIIQSLSIIGKNTQIAAKNSIVLPSMARDVFLLKKNIIELVRTQKGTPRLKAGEWFTRQGKREEAFEARMSKMPTQLDKNLMPIKTEKSFLSKIIDFFVKGLAIGGMFYIFSKILENPEFREMLQTFLEKTVEVIWDTIKFVFSTKVTELDTLFGKIEVTLGDVVAGLIAAKFALDAFKLALGIGIGTAIGRRKTPAPIPEKESKRKPGLSRSSSRKSAGLALGTIIAPRILAPIAALGVLSTLEELRDSYYGNMEDEESVEKQLQSDPMGSIHRDHIAEVYKRNQIVKLKEKYPNLKFDELSKTEEGKKIFQNEKEIKKGNLIAIKKDDNYIVAKPEDVKKVKNEIKGSQLLEEVMDSEGIYDEEIRDRIRKIAFVESGMNVDARGPILEKGIHKGDQAHGILQIMPKTAKDMGFSEKDIKDPKKAAVAGVRYFKQNYEKFGNLDAATVAHHGGPGAAKELLRTGKTTSVDLATGLKTEEYLSKIKGLDSVQVSETNTPTKTTESKTPENTNTIQSLLTSNMPPTLKHIIDSSDMLSSMLNPQKQQEFYNFLMQGSGIIPGELLNDSEIKRSLEKLFTNIGGGNTNLNVTNNNQNNNNRASTQAPTPSTYDVELIKGLINSAS